jgi:hypothetical protein
MNHVSRAEGAEYHEAVAEAAEALRQGDDGNWRLARLTYEAWDFDWVHVKYAGQLIGNNAELGSGIVHLE